ncbi:dipeptidase [Irregularibacter muris]|uniref:Dipeptidase n=2 Tax=Irregularibacter muris TaxID=1796619 RepID=A0AAE3HF05_9FIRM|nr:dipeptidase [Irregularibacter muris]
MGLNKRYDGYQAYGYLDEKDFKRFKMAKELERVEEYLVSLQPEEEERVERLARDNIFISLHDHPTRLPESLDEVFEYTRVGRDHCAYKGLSKSYYDAVFDNMLDGTTTITSANGWKWEDILYDLGMRLCDLAHQDFLIHCKKVEDIHKAYREGKIAWVASVEGAAPIENELDRIDILYGFGVRMMGITYSESNNLGSGIKEDKDGGLTAFGKKAVRRLNKVGMAIDCSHTGYKTTLDVIHESEHPIFLTHVGARALWDSKRLSPDEVLKACAQRGGVIGIEAAPHTTLTKNHLKHSIDSYMEHFEYIVDLVGIDHVAFGPDALYGDHVGIHNLYASQLSTKKTQGSLEFEKVEYVKGLENPTEASKNILRWLVKKNYRDSDITKVLGGNILSVLDKVWRS